MPDNNSKKEDPKWLTILLVLGYIVWAWSSVMLVLDGGDRISNFDGGFRPMTEDSYIILVIFGISGLIVCTGKLFSRKP